MGLVMGCTRRTIGPTEIEQPSSDPLETMTRTHIHTIPAPRATGPAPSAFVPPSQTRPARFTTHAPGAGADGYPPPVTGQPSPPLFH